MLLKPDLGFVFGSECMGALANERGSLEMGWPAHSQCKPLLLDSRCEKGHLLQFLTAEAKLQHFMLH